MTPAPTVVVHEDAADLARRTAARLHGVLATASVDGPRVDVVLTGGGVGIATLAELAALADGIDWAGVRLWWGDERFLPAGHPDRNETQARTALLDVLPVPEGSIHPMPAEGDGPWASDPDAAATVYAHGLAEAHHGSGTARDTDPVPVPAFDVVLLGVGPDGHVASLFPGHLGQRYEPGITVVGVNDSPKPPPTRISLTFEALNRAREVWLLAAGAEKARAVANALNGSAERLAVPAAGVAGTRATRWLLDRAAAAELPLGLSG